MSSTTMSEYYSTCSTYRTGGGVLGGAICISTTSAFGVAGGYVIIILVLLISLILITQKSFLVLYSVSGMQSVHLPEMDMTCIWRDSRSGIFAKSFVCRNADKGEKNGRRSVCANWKRLWHRKTMMEKRLRAKEKKSTGFLEGTLLVPPEAKKKKNRKTVLRDHKKTAEGIKNDTATDTDSVAVVSDMTSDFAGNAEHGETVRQDQKDEMPENMPVDEHDGDGFTTDSDV